MRESITPGRLYSRLSSEFRAVCCAKCVRCVLPVPSPVHNPRGPTWVMGELPTECEECATIISEIVRRHQAQYDLMDPLSMPLPAPTWHPHANDSRH